MAESGTLGMSRLSNSQTRHMMMHHPEDILFPVVNMRAQFGFEPEALRQELESGRLKAVWAGIEKEPCVTGQAFKDWMAHPETPGVVKSHVIAHMKARAKPQ